MSLIRKILFVIFILLPISNSFGAMVTEVQSTKVSDGNIGGETPNTDEIVSGIQFNNDGTKMFIMFSRDDTEEVEYSFIHEYTLSTPYDISTKTYTGDSEACHLNHGTSNRHDPYQMEISKDGTKIYFASRATSNGEDHDRIYRFDLSVPFDVSTCSYAQRTTDLDSPTYQNGSQALDHATHEDNHPQGVSISNDGKKLFILMESNTHDRILEYKLSTPYDLTTMSLVLSAGINLGSHVANPMGMEFSENGKRIFIADHHGSHKEVTQISLGGEFDTSTFTVDGEVNMKTLSDLDQLRPIAFNKSGLKMYLGNDWTDSGDDMVHEFDLVCPFNIIEGKCPPITDNKDRTAMVEAQIEIAKRTIDHSTDTALNRLKWIRRNKDKQNLTNLNIDLNFNNQIINSLTEAVKTSTTKKKKEDKKEDVFYWSEGSIVVGKIGDTSISSAKKIGTDAITIGRDQFTDKNGIKGLAFRVGRNDADVGTSGSNLDTDTYNLTYYSTSPIKDDTKFLDTIIGIGKLSSNLLTVLDGKNLTADRNGKQLYGTIRIKDEIKKNNFTLIPSGRFDIGHTILGSYKESGIGAIDVQKQHVRSKKIRTGLAVVEDLSSDDYTFKRHGKLEYVANIDRSSDFEYTYVSDGSTKFNETLHTGSLHNFNGEIGIDVIMPNSFSIFLIYERNQELGTGHTDKIHIALGYLPNKKTNYAFNLEGSENIGSEFKISKNINDFEIDFKLNNQDVMKPNIIDEASINLIHKF